MKTEKMTVPSQYDGLRLSVLWAEPEGEIKALVQLAHGMAEYKERYLPFLQALTDAGYACLIHDHRGHGASVRDEEDLGWFSKGGDEGVVSDLRQLTDLFKARHPGLKTALFGHSMGSLAVRAYAKRHDDPLDALVVCGCPTENPAAGVGLSMVRLLRRIKGERHRSALINQMMFGAFARKIPGAKSEFAWLNTDEAAVSAYEQDPLCGFVFTLNGYEALLKLMKTVYSKSCWTVSKPDLPVLFVSGGDDPCMAGQARLEAAADKLRAVGYSDIRVKTYEGLRHEILIEPRRAEVFEDVVAFLDEKIGGPT